MNARIAQVLLRPQLGGAETLVAGLDREFASRGMATSVAYLEPDGNARSPGQRVKELRSQLKAFGPTHVLGHSALPNIYARLASPRGIGVTCVLHSASDDFANPTLRLAEWALLARTHAVIAVSATAHRQYASRFPNRHRVHTVNNGVSPAFHPATRPSREPTRLISVARVADQKNPAVWRRVTELAAVAMPQLSFDWWGPATDPDHMAAVAAHNASSSNSSFRGPTQQASAELRGADIFLHTADAEANSIVLLEAAASGLPIICSQSVSTTVPDHIQVTSFRTGDAEDCLASIARVCGDWGTQCAQAAANQRHVAENFTIAAVADRYLDIMGIA